MSAFLNPLYEQVRELGLPYQIRESGGSVIIKISSNNQPQPFKNTREKFRFHTSITLNGAESPNWRSPNFEENSSFPKTSFPDSNFFRCTPPPSFETLPPPPPPASVCPTACSRTTVSSADPNQTMMTGTPETISTISTEDATVSTSLKSPQEPSVATTPSNPYRCCKCQIEFPKTPSLLNPSSISKPLPQAPPVLSGPSVLDGNPTEPSDDQLEAFKNVMVAVCSKKHL